jgi:Holliday junction resolvasome RuvABC endonuclease subunit
MILGLDISTSITGATVIDDEGNVVFCEAWDTRKFKSFFEKAAYIKNKLIDVKAGYPITKIAIEQSLQMFRAGFSSAKTLTTLSKFNGAISWICYSVMGLEPEYVSATTARKQAGIKVPRGTKAKAVVLQYVLDNVLGFEVQYTKHGNPKPGSYDRADSLVIAKSAYIEWSKNKKQPS